MKVYESIDIAARPEDVWPLVADPRLMAEWHKKLLAVDRAGTGCMGLGDRFKATYEMSGRRQRCETEVIACQPSVELTLRHHFVAGGRERFVDETYDLAERNAGTHVEQSVDLSHAGGPWWLTPVIWFITRFGHPVGEPLLAPLKLAAEKAER